MQIITYLILFALYVAHKAVHANYGYQYKVKNERTNQISRPQLIANAKI